MHPERNNNMKNIRMMILLLFATLTLAACTVNPQSAQTQSATPPSTPVSNTPATSSDAAAYDENELTVYKTRDEFHNAVIDAKESYIRGTSQTGASQNELNEVARYFDFDNPVEEIELGEIRVKKTYVTLEYWNKVDDQLGALVIQTWRKSTNETEITETEQLDILKKSSGAFYTQINGKRVLMQKVYWDNDIYDNYYVCNQYYCVENGYVIFMRVPPWLLELYPEETFFDIQTVEVPTEKAGNE